MSDLLNQASLVMVPSGYKEDTVYSVVPSDGSGDLSFTRASNGTRVNSAGLVEDVAWNLAEQSESFDNVAWVKTTDGQVTITANATTAPNGTTTAEKMIASANAGFHCVAQTQSLVAGVFTISIYAKASEYSFLQIFDSLTTDFANFNLTTGAVATVDTYTATIESVGNGWYRCTATKTNPSGNFVFRYGIVTTGTATRGESFTGNGVNGLFIWGAQLNIGTTAKPYFPTTDRLNVPRLTYQNGGGGCPSLLLEKQSTNYAQYSEDFSNGFWTKDTTTTVTANDGISPDGTQNADRFESPSSAKGIYSYGVSGSETISVYIKAGNSGNVGKSAVLFTTTATQDFILTNDWQRISVSGAASSLWALYPSATNSFTNVLIWGAQAEGGSYPTSYIPTTSSSATRVADACFKTGISSLIGQTEGTMFVDFYYNLANNTPSGSDKGIMTIRPNGGSYNNEIALLYYGDEGSSFGKTIQATVSVGGAVQCNLKTPQTLTNGYYKVAFAYKQNDFAFYVNGVQIGTDNSGSVPTCDELYLVDPLRINPNTTIKEAIIFKTRLTNAELASITTI